MARVSTRVFRTRVVFGTLGEEALSTVVRCGIVDHKRQRTVPLVNASKVLFHHDFGGHL